MELKDLATFTIDIVEKNQIRPDAKWGNAKPLNLKVVKVIEGITGRGRTGIMLFLEDDKGQTYFANSTGRLIMSLGMAVRGAMERFNDDPNQS